MAGLCALFGKSKQAYYKYDYEKLSFELARDAFAIEFARSVRQTAPGIGCANLWRIYTREFDVADPLGRDRFLALMYENGMKLRQRPRGIRTTDSRHGLPLYPDLVRSFIPTAPNQLWVSDITYIPLLGADGARNFCYLTTIMDAYSRKVLAHEVGDSLHTRHSLTCLRRAIATLQGSHDGLIHHSDRGVQYASADYTAELKAAEIRVSMTQTGNPKDNAQAERINSTVKNELLRGMAFNDIDQVREAVARAFDFYNNRRPHMSIDYLTPQQAHMRSGKLKERWIRYRRKAIEDAAPDGRRKENGNGRPPEYDGNQLTLPPHGDSLRSPTSVQPHVGILSRSKHNSVI